MLNMYLRREFYIYTNSSTPNYNFKEDRDCPDFRNASEATEFMKKSKAAGFGDHRLDRNGDGIACN
ncbi:excalibur calcium-binding domain-containing protein [Bacillus cereus]|uniref:excalibur calcium-binding domain-containing protein n=1 Tax=Bacillus cereus TaxID=1396 RepID=UPI00338FE6AC